MRFVATTLATAAATLLSLSAWAQEAVDKVVDVTEPVVNPEHLPAKSAVPQFDPSSFAGQLFWLAITFTLLYLAMSRFVLPRIGRVVETRAHAIARDLEAAEAGRAATQAALTDYEAKLAAARAEVQSLIGQAQQSASQTQTIALSAQGNKIAGDIQAAEERIAAAKQKAMGEITPVAANAAAAVVQKLTGIAPDQAKLDRAVADAINNKAA